jgi:predicted MPP superfamily phosphohydrolase
MTLKVAYISDLHLEFRAKPSTNVYDGFVQLGGTSMFFPQVLDADVLVVAGDVHPDPSIFSAVYHGLRELYKIPVIMPLGNHDYWGYPIYDDPGTEIDKVKGFTIASNTLWTHLTPFELYQWKNWIDFARTKGLTVSKWQEAHDLAVKDLLNLKPDIVVTHHAPSFQSTEEKYRGNNNNGFFMSNLDPVVDAIGAPLWIHGHVHGQFDYMLGDTRVVCNPHAYPDENPNECVNIKIIEVEKRK